MDFEDGKRRLRLVVAACGRWGGLRWGSVYRLKMAVWALFCGPGGRPPSVGPAPGLGLLAYPRAALRPAGCPLLVGT